ncbi:MAG TPA: hypothetical protein VGN69_02240 [Solirubrobacteraceae bacterium]|nr:hypothetical protein [Solirubrobacteraceae bacterium]
MNEPSRRPPVEFARLTAILRRRAPVILTCLVLVPAAALVGSLLSPTKYSASASLLFRNPALDQKLFSSGYLPPSNDPVREAATNRRLVSLATVAQRTAVALGGPWTADRVSGEVAIGDDNQSDVISLTATDRDPRVAARVANLFAEQYIAFRRDADRAKISDAQRLVVAELAHLSPRDRHGVRGQSLRKSNDQLSTLSALQTGNAERVQPARVPRSPSSPKPLRNALAGLLAGLLLGVLLALLIDRFDRRLRDSAEIEGLLGLPMLAVFQDSDRGLRPRAGAADRPLGDPDREAFRMLRASLDFLDVDAPLTTILVTSAVPEEGKSSIAAGLTEALAATGENVLLLETDLRRPSLARRLGLSSSPGLTDLLAGKVELEGVLQRTGPNGTPGEQAGDGDSEAAAASFCCITAGSRSPRPAEILRSQRMQEVLAGLAERFDHVVLDSSPLLPVVDTIELLPRVDAVVVCARVAHTQRTDLQALRSTLDRIPHGPSGLVVTCVRPRDEAVRGRYAYGYGPPAQPAA